MSSYFFVGQSAGSSAFNGGTVSQPTTFTAPLTASGGFTTSGITISPNTGTIQWASSTVMSAPANGTLQITDSTGLSTADILLGPATTNGIRIHTITPGSVVGLYNGTLAAVQTLFLGGLQTTTLGSASFYQRGAAGYGFGFADATHTTVYSNSVAALSFDSSQNATLSGATTQLSNSASTLLFGNADNTGAQFIRTGAAAVSYQGGTGANGTLTVQNSLVVTSRVATPAVYGGTNFSSSLGQITFPAVNTGTVAFAAATGTLTGAGFSFTGGAIQLPTLTADPPGTNGMIYYNSSTPGIRVYVGGTWQTLTVP